jgi:MFS family permease
MEDVWVTFGVLSVLCVAAQLYKRMMTSPKSASPDSPGEARAAAATHEGFGAFQLGWLGVYLGVMFSDWLQGPYIYALYREYGFHKAQIAHLFIAGYLSSMIFGTVTGSLADKLGRKWGCLCFGVVYSISCVTKLSPSYSVLMFGRLLGGIGTSLLFSVFEAWMVHEHKHRHYPDALLSQTFSLATFGNGLAAIGAGIVASHVVDASGVLYAPFLLSMALLVITTVYVYFAWGENYGDAQIEFRTTLSNAMSDISSDLRVPLLGCVQALFEGSMYIFVFMWTPALEAALPPGATISHGLIFACFMVSTMIGSTLFSILVTMNLPLEKIGLGTLGVSMLALVTPVFSMSRFIPFLIFEVCCGLYWPCFGTLRGSYLPERSRSTVMNFFRVPLNLLVVLTLVRVDLLAEESVFLIIAFQLGLATLLQLILLFKAK